VPDNNPTGEIILFQSHDGQSKVQVRFQDSQVWLTQASMGELFQTTPQNITIHLREIYRDGELEELATCKEYLQVRNEGKRKISRSIKHYNLDAIIAIGLRVRSRRGTQFRQWAIAKLHEFLKKGFLIDDDRMKGENSVNYFDELLLRIRDIRSSERRFYQKVTDIYATSVDYDANSTVTQEFYATVQNKLHWAIHGQTAAEVIVSRANASQKNMGLTSWKNSPDGPIRKNDVFVAKNYLSDEELEALNLIVTAYLDFAELQARSRKPMYMRDWLLKLDGFLQLSEKDVLTTAGKISRQLALEHAEKEFEKYEVLRLGIDDATRQSDFDQFTAKVPQRLPKGR
jgi:hypothetical protein